MPPKTQTTSNRSASTAIIYCEDEFGKVDGKTANGLVRHSEKYQILAVVDSSKAGNDAGLILDHVVKGIPVCKNLKDATERVGVADFFIFGKAPASGMLSLAERKVVLGAIKLGMNIVNGLHEFLNDDPQFIAAALTHNVTIRDVRKPRDKKDLRPFTDQLSKLSCPRIAVLGTDCAVGKRTTAAILTQALNDCGIKAVMVGTGQTGLIQGARYGLAMDAVPSQFCAGELEATIMEAYDNERPDVIIVEGQGSLSHPAYSTSSFILRGSTPQAVVLQHAPARPFRCDFVGMPMPSVAAEINLIQTFSNTRVIGLTINHENMNAEELAASIAGYELELGIPVTDALLRPSKLLVDMVVSAFPELGVRLAPVAA